MVEGGYTPPEVEDAAEKGTVIEIELMIRDDIRIPDAYAKINQETGEVEALVDEEGEPREGMIQFDDVYLDEDMMKVAEDYFLSHGVGVVDSRPWTTDEGDDFPGFLYLSAPGLNDALENKEIKIVKGSGGYVFEGMPQL